MPLHIVAGHQNEVSVAAVIRVIAEIAGRDPGSLTEHTNLYTELDLDSLGELEVLVALEDCFDVDISTRDSQRIKTVGDLTALLRQLALKRKSRGA